jgi:L-ascorbate metabolism protein UlaG (beta-lactamase superfamily)
MNKHRLLLSGISIILILGLFTSCSKGGEMKNKAKEINIDSIVKNIHWLGHASVRINGSKTIYVDPYELSENAEKADIILITHNHYDHLSVEDIKKIANDQTTVVIPASLLVSLKYEVKKVDIGQTITVKGVEIRAVPAYNIIKTFHPRSQGYVGYVFALDGITYYHAGDTDHIPEMRGVKADVVFLPVGGTYTMDAVHAAEAVKDIKPALAIPIHWGSIVGSKADAEKFKSLCACEVRILEKEH